MDSFPLKELRLPISTYRLQFNHEFTFKQANAIVSYLNDLGITDAYASPLAKAHSGSLHGYDVIDPHVLNPEIGSEQDFDEFSKKLTENQMGLLLDIVPNHMCIADSSNVWWNDILENGQASRYANFFTIDWNTDKPKLNNKVLLPFLDNQYGTVIENQEITLLYDKGSFQIKYADKYLPLRPKTWNVILEPLLKNFDSGSEDPSHIELNSILIDLSHLPDITETDPQKTKEQYFGKEAIKRRIDNLMKENEGLKAALDKTVTTFNGVKGQPTSFDPLEALLKEQAYRLCFWKIANEEINYRRFFDQNQFAGVQVERPEVFKEVHELPFKLIAKGSVTGLRIDHVDGLYDPDKYFEDLQKGCLLALNSSSSQLKTMEDNLSKEEVDKNFYVIVEKILTGNEQLKSKWKVHGTTGYDFMNLLNGLYVDHENRAIIRSIYKDFVGFLCNPFELMFTCKKFILLVSMSSELQMLARLLDRISDQHRCSRDFTFDSLRFALSNVIACFLVYRSYISPSDTVVEGEDRQYIERAVRKSKQINPAINASIFDFIKNILLLENPPELTEDQIKERKEFIMQFQQLTGPVMAKGEEDTAFYRSYPLASLNEVGGDLFGFGTTIEKFHEENIKRLKEWPYTLLATTTHDTKRSEDTRARINVLSEIPEEWKKSICYWRELNQIKKVQTEEEGEIPDANEEYLLYQTLVGSWPIEGINNNNREVYSKRIEAYMLKAIKEAKMHTSWINPDEKYDETVQDFVRKILSSDKENLFLQDFQNFMPKIIWAGMFNSLSQTLLKLTSPGIPDIYQGSELWNLTLVDPDNRQPVDYAIRKTMLEKIKKESENLDNLLGILLKSSQDGAIKLYITWRLLNLRKDNRELFEQGNYNPLEIKGDKKEHVIAFTRYWGGKNIIVAAARNFTKLSEVEELPVGDKVWKNTSLSLPPSFPQGQYRDIFSGARLEINEEVGLGQIFKRLPIALLEFESHNS